MYQIPTFRAVDGLVLMTALAAAVLLAGSETVLTAYTSATRSHPLWMGFAKFAVLATFGECLAARLNTGRYLTPNFGLCPKALVWGVLGMAITLSFAVFSTGVPQALESFGLPNAAGALAGPLSLNKVLVALCVSVCLNAVTAPVFMTAHRLADLHITACGGALRSLWHAPNPSALFRQVDWDILWGFVLAKTVPLFWIPAHTVTFLLPPTFRVLFAAILGAVLGVFLALKKERREDAHERQAD